VPDATDPGPAGSAERFAGYVARCGAWGFDSARPVHSWARMSSFVRAETTPSVPVEQLVAVDAVTFLTAP